jgi:ABC-type transport system involved in multi-copper enzyme maturation permease subunit
MTIAPTTPERTAEPSPWRAWWFLVRLSLMRQVRLRQMVWIALGLLVFSAAFVALNTAMGRWLMLNWRYSGMTYRQWADNTETVLWAVPQQGGFPLDRGILAACRFAMEDSPFWVFTQGIVMSLLMGFLLPLWSLSFATEAIGGDREHNNLIWLLTRPLPRPAIYLGKFVALLPWALGLNLGGFALLCLLGGPPGQQALRLFWPAILCSTLAFAALFHLIAAAFRRPAVLGLVYVFFLEIILNLMPGYLKRMSISFYARCMMFEAGKDYGIEPIRPNLYVPVDGTTATVVLLLVTVALLALGTFVFSRAQYHETA